MLLRGIRYTELPRSGARGTRPHLLRSHLHLEQQSQAKGPNVPAPLENPKIYRFEELPMPDKMRLVFQLFIFISPRGQLARGSDPSLNPSQYNPIPR